MNQKPNIIQYDFQINMKKVVRASNYEVFADSFVEILDKDVSESDVKAAISKLKCNKSAGNNSIVSEMLKAAKDRGIVSNFMQAVQYHFE